MFWHYSSNISPESHFPLQSSINLTHSSLVASKIGLPGSWTSPLLSWFFWQKEWNYEIRVLLQTKFKRHLPTPGLLAFMASIFLWLYNTSLWVSIIKAVWRVKQAIPRGIWADVRVMPHSKWHQTMIPPGHRQVLFQHRVRLLSPYQNFNSLHLCHHFSLAWDIYRFFHSCIHRKSKAKGLKDGESTYQRERNKEKDSGLLKQIRNFDCYCSRPAIFVCFRPKSARPTVEKTKLINAFWD